MKRICLAMVATVLSACTGLKPNLPPQRVPVSTHDAEVVKFIHEKGDNLVKGSAFLTQQAGGVVTCAGKTVSLVPASIYATERIGMIYNSVERGYQPLMALYAGAVVGSNGALVPQFRSTVIDPPPSYLSDQRKTVCDARGEFEFDNVAPGTYYVITQVTWSVGGNPQGGSLMQRTTLPQGSSKQNFKLLLTQN
jgi:hypothetical protein